MRERRSPAPLPGKRIRFRVVAEMQPQDPQCAGHELVERGLASFIARAIVIHVPTGTVVALTTNVGYATAVSPPPPTKRTPDPPTLLLPFIRGR